MRKLIVVVSGVTLLLSALALAVSGTAASPPPKVPSLPTMPAAFYGTVTLDGASVPDGTSVTALINGTVYSKTKAKRNDQDMVYVISIPGDDPATPAKEGGVEGDIVTFEVGGYNATQQAQWHSGTQTQTNLTASASTNGKKTPPGKLR